MVGGDAGDDFDESIAGLLRESRLTDPKDGRICLTVLPVLFSLCLIAMGSNLIAMAGLQPKYIGPFFLFVVLCF